MHIKHWKKKKKKSFSAYFQCRYQTQENEIIFQKIFFEKLFIFFNVETNRVISQVRNYVEKNIFWCGIPYSIYKKKNTSRSNVLYHILLLIQVSLGWQNQPKSIYLLVDTAFCTPYNSGPLSPMMLKF